MPCCVRQARRVENSVGDCDARSPAGSTKHIALRIAIGLCEKAPRRIGDGRKVVLIAYCDLMNPSPKNGNTCATIRCGRVWSSIQMTGHTSLNSMPNECGV